MDVWKYEIISRIEQDISFVRFAHKWDILGNTRNKFHISAHHVLFSISFNDNQILNFKWLWWDS